MPRPSSTCLASRLRQLSLDSPPASALFYARLFAALCPNDNDHEAVHILALCLLATKETYSALHAVRHRAEAGCKGCAMIVARCCQVLGRYTEGQAVLERALRRGTGSTCKPPCAQLEESTETVSSSARAQPVDERTSHSGRLVAQSQKQRGCNGALPACSCRGPMVMGSIHWAVCTG